MMKYFPKVHKDIWAHVLQAAPEECCGMIVKGKYIPSINISEDPERHFRISREAMIETYKNKNVEAIIHSHIDYPHASEADMRNQEAMNIPWGIAFVNDGKKGGIHFWGKQLSVMQLMERPFIHGIYDCYSLVADFYKLNFKMDLPVVPREYGWWEQGKDLLRDGFEAAGFKPVAIACKMGDILLFKMRQPKLSHCMLHIGDDELIHHARNRLSTNVNVYKPIVKRANLILRHKDL
jgi:proteasome lid subunit RPN8/RPN11